jgi:hypothetical protein
MSLLKKRIQRIKKTLGQDDLELAASLLINTVASDDMFGYWSGCCHDSERVPKILKYIKHISFNPLVPTAVINFMEGDLMIGTQFFLDYIDGPEDLLFILIHERNHLILRKLYPDVRTQDYPKHLFNFGEDVFINAISRKHVPSTLPERFYNKPMELLLTARHNKINWDNFKLNERDTYRIKEAHGAMYMLNYSLLKALGETRIISARSCGYQQWMDMILEWHKKKQEQSQKVSKEQSDNNEAPIDTDAEHSQNGNGNNGDNTEPNEDTEAESSNGDGDITEPDKDNDAESCNDSPEEDNSPDEPGMEEGEQEVLESNEDDEPSNQPSGECGEDEIEEDNDNGITESDGVQAEDTVFVGSDQDGEDKHDQTDTGIDSALKSIVPLVQDDSTSSIGSQVGASEKANNMTKLPLPNLKPNDPVVQLILSTCEIVEFRNQVLIFEGDILEHVDGLIKGILSDRATERSFDGYSVSVPFSITRRDVFALSAGETPVLWQRKVGVERPFIDVYVDVSGSMTKYYGYIPFIYDALKHVMGRIFQFSTKIVEVDYRDLYLHTTGGTSFDKVALHMINEQTRCAIVFSDGMSRISGMHMDTLKRQLEHLVYIKIKENDYINWEQLATDIILLQKRR